MLASPFLYAWGAVEVLYAWGAVSPDGIIVSDSGAFIRGKEHWSVYMVDVLQALYERTGLRCMLVARGGLAFVNHRNRLRGLQLEILEENLGMSGDKHTGAGQ